MADTPTPLDTAPTTLNGATSVVTMSNGNLTATHSNTTNNAGVTSTTVLSSGKWYWETTFTVTHGSSDCMAVSLSGATFGNIVTNGTKCVAVYAGTGIIWSNDASTGKTLGNIPAGAVVGMALDFDNRRAWFRKKSGGTTGNWNGDAAANPETGIGGVTVGVGAATAPFVGFGGTATATNDQITANFGASPYAMPRPDGFIHWNGTISPPVVPETPASSYAGGASRGRMIRKRRKREDEDEIAPEVIASTPARPLPLPPAPTPPPPEVPPAPGLMAGIPAPPITVLRSPPIENENEDDIEIALLLELLS